MKLQNEQLSNFDIKDWLNTNLLYLLQDLDLEIVLAGFSDGVGSARVSEIIEYKDIKIDDVSALNNESKLVTFTVCFEGKCSICSDWDDYVNHQEIRDFWGDDQERFESIWLEENQNITVEVDLVLNKNNSEIDSQEIMMVSGSYGDIAW